MLLVSLLLTAHSTFTGAVIRQGNIDAIRLFLALGIDPDGRDEHGLRPLDYAAWHNQPDIARLLFENHARVNLTTQGSTALDLACAMGSAEAARILIDNGADVNRVFPSGRTPLHIAAAHGYLKVGELLIDRGADPNARSDAGLSALDEAVTKNFPALVALLVSAGGTPNPDHLRTALRLNRVAMVKAILTDSNDHLAPLLEEALRRHQSEMAIAILQAGADVNARDEGGFNPLHNAALAGNLGAVKMLLDHGADINAATRESGATALYMAATMGRADVVGYLLEKGADPNKGPSPSKAAQSAGFDQIATAIRDHSQVK